MELIINGLIVSLLAVFNAGIAYRCVATYLEGMHNSEINVWKRNKIKVISLCIVDGFSAFVTIVARYF